VRTRGSSGEVSAGPGRRRFARGASAYWIDFSPVGIPALVPPALGLTPALGLLAALGLTPPLGLLLAIVPGVDALVPPPASLCAGAADEIRLSAERVPGPWPTERAAP